MCASIALCQHKPLQVGTHRRHLPLAGWQADWPACTSTIQALIEKHFASRIANLLSWSKVDSSNTLWPRPCISTEFPESLIRQPASNLRETSLKYESNMKPKKSCPINLLRAQVRVNIHGQYNISVLAYI